MTFSETIRDAVRDFAEHGYDSEERLTDWVARIRQAAVLGMVPEREVQEKLRETLQGAYERLIERGGIMRLHPGVGQFTINRVRPELHAALSRQVLASANLIKLNRDRAVEETLQRFSGWATSVPQGGSRVVDRREVVGQTRRELAKLAFIDRRVSIDQTHKLMSNLSQIVARGGGALAATWRQHYTKMPRIEHTRREGKVYLVRDSWAHERGLVKPGSAGYTDEVDQPGEPVFCRCTWTWNYALRDLPDDMITQKGKDELARVRRELAA